MQVLNEAHALVDEIRQRAEGLDSVLLLEVYSLTDADFTEPMDAEALLASLRSDGLL